MNDAKSTSSTPPLEEAESTDLSSSEEANLLESLGPSERCSCENTLVAATKESSGRRGRWSDLLDPEMLAQESRLELDDDEEGLQARDDIDATEQGASTKSKRRSRRRKRHAKPSISSASSAADTLRKGPAAHTQQNYLLGYHYAHPQMSPKSVGLVSSGHIGMTSTAQGGRNVVTWTDILGQDFSLCPGASTGKHFRPAAAAQISQASEPWANAALLQDFSCPSVVSQEQGARTSWHVPAVTPWNPPHWISAVYTETEQAEQAQHPASGFVPSNNDVAEQLRAMALETYED